MPARSRPCSDRTALRRGKPGRTGGAQAVPLGSRRHPQPPACVTHEDEVNTSRSTAGGSRRDPHELTATQVSAMEADLARALASKGYPGPRAAQAREATAAAAFAAARIKVYFHVITDGTRGRLTASEISSQVNVLNSAFSGSGVQPYLISTDTTSNTNWYNLRDVRSRSAP